MVGEYADYHISIFVKYLPLLHFDHGYRWVDGVVSPEKDKSKSAHFRNILGAICGTDRLVYGIVCFVVVSSVIIW